MHSSSYLIVPLITIHSSITFSMQPSEAQHKQRLLERTVIMARAGYHRSIVDYEGAQEQFQQERVAVGLEVNAPTGQRSCTELEIQHKLQFLDSLHKKVIDCSSQVEQTASYWDRTINSLVSEIHSGAYYLEWQDLSQQPRLLSCNRYEEDAGRDRLHELSSNQYSNHTEKQSRVIITPYVQPSEARQKQRLLEQTVMRARAEYHRSIVDYEGAQEEFQQARVAVGFEINAPTSQCSCTELEIAYKLQFLDSLHKKVIDRSSQVEQTASHWDEAINSLVYEIHSGVYYLEWRDLSQQPRLLSWNRYEEDADRDRLHELSSNQGSNHTEKQPRVISRVRAVQRYIKKLEGRQSSRLIRTGEKQISLGNKWYQSEFQVEAKGSSSKKLTYRVARSMVIQPNNE